MLGWDELDGDELFESIEESLGHECEPLVKTVLSYLKRVRINSLRDQTNKKLPDKAILLDTCAEVSVFKDQVYFYHIEESNESLIIEGVEGGSGVHVSLIGETDFGVLYHSNRIIANILSFGDCVDKLYSVRYDSSLDEFKVQPVKDGPIFLFRRFPGKANIYIYDPDAKFMAVATVKDNMAKYTKREVKRAELARKYLKNLVNTAGTLIKMLNKNKIRNMPIGVLDVARSIDIWGKDLANLKGKTTRDKAQVYQREHNKIARSLIPEKQILYIDIMFFNREPFLLTKTSPPLNYRAAMKLANRTAGEIAKNLQDTILNIQSLKLQVIAIASDEESGVDSPEMRRLISKIDPTIDIDITSGGEALGVIERDIRTVKERLRGVINTLPFQLDEVLEEWLVTYVIYFLNWLPSDTNVEWQSAFEKIFGRTLNADTDLLYGFGDYVQISEGETDNSMEERTRGALALAPCGDDTSAWHFLAIDTWKTVTRNRCDVLPMPTETINYINNKARTNKGSRGTIGEVLRVGLYRSDDLVHYYSDEDADSISDEEELDVQVPPYVLPDGTNFNPVPQYTVEDVEDDDSIFEVNERDDEFADRETVGNAVEEIDPNLIFEIFGPDSDNEDKDIHEEVAPPPEDDNPQAPAPRYNLRSGNTQLGRQSRRRFDTYERKNVVAALRTDSKYRSLSRFGRRKVLAMNLTIKQAIRRKGYDAVLSIVKEITQLNERGTFNGVILEELSPDDLARVISSSMFLKEKYSPDGVFEKLKARLVAGGHLQDRTVYDNGGSPTATTSSVFLVATLAAHEGRAVGKIDFPGAFLNAAMPEDDSKTVFVKLNKFESMVLLNIDPSYDKFIDKKGHITVRLRRALYGCVESARLWYEKLSTDLAQIGYVKNPVDMCVFNRNEQDGTQSTLVLHVDDCLITASTEDHLSKIIEEIEKMYPKLEKFRGRVINYLGMIFDFSTDNKVKVTMPNYVEDVLEFCEDVEGVAKYPAADNLFKIDSTSPLLSDKDKEFFHSGVAKILYLAKRIRPDMLTAVSFLTRRVNFPSIQDLTKFSRLIKYLRYSKDLGICLEATVNLQVLAYVDASHGVHEDMKSHTGCTIGIGKGPIYSKSTTQKLNSKSSSESELIGLSDSSNQIIWTRNFLLGQGYHLPPATVFQDNQSTIKMIENGKSNSERTRHIAVRFYFIADRVASKEIQLQYMPTGDMLADILTKPLNGILFYKLRAALLNWPTDNNLSIQP